MVRPDTGRLPRKWEDAPVPILVAEILSGTTRRRDHEQKRAFYLENGVAEYWIVDGESRNIRVIRPRRSDIVADASLVWHPAAATEPLVVDLVSFFREALG
jgi:Uma2 family endonuclease